MADSKPTLLVTGANGDIGTALLPHVSPHYDLRLAVWTGRPTLTDEKQLSEHYPDVRRVDIGDLDAMVDLVDGVDAIVHLAGERQVNASWEALRRPNVEGVYNLFEASRRAGVGKVVFASSNHAMGYYDGAEQWPIHPDQPVRPDSLYGVTKAYGEVMGRYAADFFALRVICLRIGWVLERPHNEMALRMWLSHRDLGQLMLAALGTDIGYGIYYGVSANTRCKWDTTAARRDLGYEPVDDSEAFAAEVLG
jgi:nucleoside-diphosphate-sugar epimerase